MSALQAIESLKTDTNEIQGRIINKLHSCPKSISLIWVPGHCNIHGNEQADALAKSAVELEGTWEVPRDLKSSLSFGKTSINLLWQGQWTNLNINTVKPILGEWNTANRPTRREEIVLSRVRMNCTRLTHMTPYVNRTFPPNCQTCNSILSISHLILHCSRFTRERRPLVNYCRANNIPFTLDSVLGDGNLEVTDILMHFLKETHLIDEM